MQLRCDDEGKHIELPSGADYNMPRTFSDELTGTSVPVGQLLELREGNYLYHVKYDIDHQTTSDLQSAFAFRAVPTTGGDSGIAGTSDSSGFFIQNEGLANPSMLGIDADGTTKKRRISVNGDVTSLSLEYWLDGNSLPGAGLPGSNRCLGLCVSGMSNSNTATGTFHTAGRILFARRTVIIYSKS